MAANFAHVLLCACCYTSDSECMNGSEKETPCTYMEYLFQFLQTTSYLPLNDGEKIMNKNCTEWWIIIIKHCVFSHSSLSKYKPKSIATKVIFISKLSTRYEHVFVFLCMYSCMQCTVCQKCYGAEFTTHSRLFYLVTVYLVGWIAKCHVIKSARKPITYK